jgi:Caspase domain
MAAGGTDDWAVVIGIQHYPGLANDKLTGPVNDAIEFAKWLASTGVTKKHLFLIKSQPATSVKKAKPALVQVQEAFEEIVEQAKQRRQAGAMQLGRRLWIYLAGHGFEPVAGTPALLTAEANDIRMSHVAGRLYAERLRDAGIFAEVVLFMDTCRQNADSRPLEGWPFKSSFNPGKPSLYFYGLASKSSHVARERKLGNKTRGVFSYAVLEGLKGRAERAGQISDLSLTDYVLRRMKDLDGADGDEQPPDLQPDLSSPRIVFSTRAVKKFPVTIKVPKGLRGKSLEITDGHNTLVPAQKAAPTVTIRLPSGTHVIIVDGAPHDVVKVDGTATTIALSSRRGGP